VSFTSRELNVRLFAPDGTEIHLLPVCNLCDTTGGAPKPNCPPPSKPQCPQPSKPPQGPKKRTGQDALDLAVLRDQLRETLQVR
jgi:hypothetical protein